MVSVTCNKTKKMNSKEIIDKIISTSRSAMIYNAQLSALRQYRGKLRNAAEVDAKTISMYVKKRCNQKGN